MTQHPQFLNCKPIQIKNSKYRQIGIKSPSNIKENVDAKVECQIIKSKKMTNSLYSLYIH